GANTTGVRSPYAVLAARLSPAELPPPHGQRPARPPWCGQCDEITRMLDFYGDAPRPCPRCRPPAATDRAAAAEPAHAGTPRGPSFAGCGVVRLEHYVRKRASSGQRTWFLVDG